MKKVNYSQLFAIQRELEKVILKACPVMAHKSGIYFYTRIDFDGKKHAYVGKSVDCMNRSVSHLRNYDQKIDVSIKKYGFYDEQDNPSGWKLNVLYFSFSELDDKERYFIDLYSQKGYEMYNIESGGTLGKTDINERKAGKTYTDGKKFGYEQARKEIANLFDKYLDVVFKGKINKTKEKALEKFMLFLEGKDETKRD